MNPILEVKDLNYIYSIGTPFEHQALDNVNFAVNRGESERVAELPVWEIGIFGDAPMVSLFMSGKEGCSVEAQIRDIHDGTFILNLPPESAMIWKGLLPLDLEK